MSGYLPLRLAPVDEVRPAGDVDDGLDEALVERDGGVAEAGDAALVAEGLAQRLAEDDGDVLDGVVDVDLDVAGRPDGEVDERVLGQRAQHVVVERHPGLDVGLAGAVEVEAQLDARLARRAGERGGAVRAHAGSSWRGSGVVGVEVLVGVRCESGRPDTADRNASVSAGVPAVTRR